MKYEFKIGDKVRVIHNKGYEDLLLLGEIFTVIRDKNTEDNSDLIKVRGDDGKEDDWSICRFEKVIEGKAGRPKKVKPIVKHIVLNDSCSNLIGIFDNYETASEQKPNVGDTYSVYKMIKVASIKTDVVVKITKVMDKKK